MDKLLEAHNLWKPNHEKIEKLNGPITGKETELLVKNLATKTSPGPHGFTGEFYQTFKELTTILLKFLRKTEEERTLPNTYYEPNIILILKTIKTIQEKYRLISLM